MRWLLFLLGITWLTAVQAQQVDLGNLKQMTGQKLIRIGGGVSASTVFYDGNDGQNRQPFTYYLNGHVNFNIMGQVNLPFSFNFTNQGSNYGYPTLPNRLSVHPKYKWVTGHVGDIAMSFSPYTLNGHMFTGVGVDLKPKGPFTVSAMYGRLQRAVEYDTANVLVQAAYQRMGYGAKVRYDQRDHYLGMTMFSAKEDPTSLSWAPDSLGIFPEQNVALSWEGGVTLADHIHFSGTYGLSLLTRDARAPREKDTFTDRLLGNRTATQAYHAYKMDITFQFLKNNLGVGYERIDPDYETLGAYYFNNDYENVTLHYARPFVNNKVNVAVTWGLQRDDLANNKEQSTQRFVSGANLDYTPSEKLNFSLSYSGFQTYMNVRSQFDYINGQTPYDNLDTLNYTQLSQNLALNTNYAFGKNENRRHSLNASLSYQEAADKQGDVIRPGALSRFYNASTSYGLLLAPEAMQCTVALNSTYNDVGGEEYFTIGPTLGARAKVCKKMLNLGLTYAYNKSYTDGQQQAEVMNVRTQAAYRFLKKHNLSANAIWQHRALVTRTTRSITATLAYSYAF